MTNDVKIWQCNTAVKVDTIKEYYQYYHYFLCAFSSSFCCDLFLDVQDAPRVLLESSSSMESLVSTSESVTSPVSNLGSSPPVSPYAAAKKSYFNPAEVDKLPSAMKASLLSCANWFKGS